MINILFVDDDRETTSTQIASLSQSLEGYKWESDIQYLNPHDYLDGESEGEEELVDEILRRSTESLDFVAIDMGLVRGGNNPELAIKIGGWVREYNKIAGIIFYSGTLKKYLKSLSELHAKNAELSELLFSVAALGFHDRNSIESEVLFAIDEFHFELEVQRAIKNNPEIVFDMNGTQMSSSELLGALREKSEIGQEFLRMVFRCGFSDTVAMFGV